MQLTTLDAVNIVLRRLGETPVTSVDETYPTLQRYRQIAERVVTLAEYRKVLAEKL